LAETEQLPPGLGSLRRQGKRKSAWSLIE